MNQADLNPAVRDGTAVASGVRLEDVLVTHLLRERASRPPNHAADSRALLDLAQTLGDAPDAILQKLVDAAMALTGAESAGVSVLEGDDGVAGGRVFRWHATAGAFGPLVRSTLPRDFSPCGVVLDRDGPQLMSDPARFYPYIVDLTPGVAEVLLVPFYRGSTPVGTVWVVAHSDAKRFDAEDARVVANLAKFASAAVRTISNVESAEAARRRLDSALIAGEVGTFEWDILNDRLWGDRNFERIFGIKLDASGAAPLATYAAAIHPGDREAVLERVRRAVETGCDYEAEYRITSAVPPRWVIARGKVERDGVGRDLRFPGVVLDVTERKHAEVLLAAQNRALERVTAGAPLPEALAALTGVVEEQYGGAAVAAILLLDGAGRLRVGAAPGLPPEYNAAIDGIEARAGLGTCADAAARGVAVVTCDIAAAPSWHGLSHLPLGLGLRAAWSMPIRASDGRVLGTFGTYFRECREPTPRERRIVEGLCRVASVAIERRRADESLRESEERYRRLVETAYEGVWTIDAAGRTTYVNRRMAELLGYAPEEMIGRVHTEFMWEQDRPKGDTDLELRRRGTAQVWDQRYRRKDDGELWTVASCTSLYDADGKVVGALGMFTDITDRKLVEAERERLLEAERAARAAAETANREKDRFLAVLSHELRTPLTPVVMTVPAMEIDPEMPFKFRDDLAMVRRNIDLEVKLIDDLLDLSRVTSGKLRLQMQPVGAHELLLHVLRSSVSEISGKRLNVRHQLNAANDHLTADPARLQQVFWNLLRNAVKFTPDGGEVVVRTWNAAAGNNGDGGGGHLLVEVSDTGVGIEPEVLPRIFDAFEQGDARMTRQFGGLGLGLAIAKAVVEMHGGTIAAASGGRGRGAVFTVRLNTVAAGAATELPARGGEGIAGRRSSSRARILLVEDHPDTAQVLARLLNASGYEVKTAHTVASALNLATAEPFDIVISDIGLPDATGYELMGQIRDSHGIKGIALSGYGMEDDLRKSREAGFVDHVVKPVNVEQLEAVISRVLRDPSES